MQPPIIPRHPRSPRRGPLPASRFDENPASGPAGSRSSARPGLAARARAAAMVEDYYPVEWSGRQVVALPERIGISNAGQAREELLSVINRGAQGLIADMTATISCYHAGADAGHTAYAGMRQVNGGNASSAGALTDHAPENAVDPPGRIWT